eukprot:GHVL01008659.1.p1 GENE.GHVL01008659.1~~GHVL01008659.1.p1  ORF type:complete len:118 (-),score=8.54 GHVL01008659.1:56-409(-)
MITLTKKVALVAETHAKDSKTNLFCFVLHKKMTLVITYILQVHVLLKSGDDRGTEAGVIVQHWVHHLSHNDEDVVVVIEYSAYKLQVIKKAQVHEEVARRIKPTQDVSLKFDLSFSQ